MRNLKIILLAFMLPVALLSCTRPTEQQGKDMTYREGGAMRPDGRPASTPPGSAPR